MEPSVPGRPGGSEGGARATEAPLPLQLRKETQLTISKLRELKLDDPSAPGMTVFGENGSQTAILHGTIPQKERYLVISPKGFFLAESRSSVTTGTRELSLILDDIRNKGKESTRISIDDKNGLVIDDESDKSTYRFQAEKIVSTPEETAEILKSAVESSRELAQKSLLDEMARARAANTMLDSMIRQEQSSQPPPPGPTT